MNANELAILSGPPSWACQSQQVQFRRRESIDFEEPALESDNFRDSGGVRHFRMQHRRAGARGTTGFCLNDWRARHACNLSRAEGRAVIYRIRQPRR